jgi:hypothetical protein
MFSKSICEAHFLRHETQNGARKMRVADWGELRTARAPLTT